MFSNLNGCHRLLLIIVTMLGACGDGSGTATGSAPDPDPDLSIIAESPCNQPAETTQMRTSAKEMCVGDILDFELSEAGDEVRIDFEEVEKEAEFALVTVNTNTAMPAQGTVKLHHNEEETEDLDIENLIRERESEIIKQDLPRASREFRAGKETAAPVVIAEGDEKTFRVLSSLTSSRSYQEVSAMATCVRDTVIVYTDKRVTDANLTHDEVIGLCELYNAQAKSTQEIFGPASDVNGDRHLSVLLTPQVNQLGFLMNRIFTGFFSASDLLSQSAGNPASNEQEIVYLSVPDPDGTFGTNISKAFALSNFLPVVFPHELQHAINFNYHVFLQKKEELTSVKDYLKKVEQPWLNEGLSHLAEDLAGQNQENYSRYALYLRDPSKFNIDSRGANLETRGAAYLLLRYLYEQSNDGDAFLKALIGSNLTGIANLEAAVGKSFNEIFLRWQTAMFLTNKNITRDFQYTYRDRIKNETTGQWTGVCMKCDPEDGRKINGSSGTILTGVRYNSSNSSTMSINIPRLGSQFFRWLTNYSTMTNNSSTSIRGSLIRIK